jgi:hypothetical protein
MTSRIGSGPVVPQTPATRTVARGEPLAPAPGTPARTFPTSADGTPLFAQGDTDWKARRLGSSATLAQAGCAMTSTAMALSKILGELITPADLDAYLDANRGYAGDALDWSRVGTSRNLVAELKPWSLANLDATLSSGRPAVIGVDYKQGSGGGANGTDHWVCVTEKVVALDGSVAYRANDPGTGNVITLKPDRSGKLVGDGVGALGTYRSSGQLRVFRDL